jgi:hypothetical protein
MLARARWAIVDLAAPRLLVRGARSRAREVMVTISAEIRRLAEGPPLAMR